MFVVENCWGDPHPQWGVQANDWWQQIPTKSFNVAHDLVIIDAENFRCCFLQRKQHTNKTRKIRMPNANMLIVRKFVECFSEMSKKITDAVERL